MEDLSFVIVWVRESKVVSLDGTDGWTRSYCVDVLVTVRECRTGWLKLWA